jgi:hypothetical protein
VLAAIPLPKDLTYSERVRAWSVSLVLNWAASLCLLALGYVFPGPGKYDFVANRIYRCLDDHLWQLDNYPSIVDPATFIIYACYATAAVILIKIVASIFENNADRQTDTGPNVVTIVGLTAFIMMFVHGYTKV